jgi:hypothetical protein
VSGVLSETDKFLMNDIGVLLRVAECLRPDFILFPPISPLVAVQLICSIA